MRRLGTVSFFLAIVVAIAVGPPGAEARIEGMKVSNDNRPVVLIEHFGFVPGGVYSLKLENLRFVPRGGGASSPSSSSSSSSSASSPTVAPKVGFLIRRTRAEEGIAEVTQRSAHGCVLDSPEATEVVHLIDVASPTLTHEATVAKGGLYQTLLVNCDGGAVSFSLSLTQYNPGPDYLAVGHSPLPALYFALGLSVFVMLLVWVRELVVNRRQVMKIHGLMAVLLALKCLSLLFESGMYHYIKLHGHASGWDVAFYFFHSLKGITLFVVIMLIGTGWSFLKPFLSGNEKKILAVVIPLQVVSNIAGIVMDETMPGTQSWLTWTDIVHLFDIICCCVVLFPIGWSIRQLQDASATDGKAARNLTKLRLFRQFYSVVWAYIYFTRIVVYILRLTLNYRYVWVATLCEEVGTLAFYLFSGHRFRPLSSNPYFLVDTRDLDEDGDSDRDIEERGLFDREDGRRGDAGRGGAGGNSGEIQLESIEPDFSL